ncbi:MAG: hypothetical protein ABW007_00930 [Chitinophagaceae bacterium]
MPLKSPLITLLALAVISIQPAFSQSEDSIRLDYNPRLTRAESEWLNQHITHRGDFDFTGKNVVFVELLTGGFYGIGKFTLPLHQKHIFIPQISGSFYKIFVLTAAEKQKSGGLDAIFVAGNSKHKGKMKRLKREGLLDDYSNNYPQIPDDAGQDNNPVLTPPNATFFNEIYRNRTSYLPDSFDFTGKKIAVFSGHPDVAKVQRIQLPEYVLKVRTALDQDGRYIPEFTTVLTEEQKKESGGYDVIISYRNKIGTPLTGLIGILKKQ